MNQETKETKPFVINPDDVAAGRIYICRNGARVKLAPMELLNPPFRYVVTKMVDQANAFESLVGYTYTKEGDWLVHLVHDRDIICLETLAEPEINPAKPKPTPRKSFTRTGVIKSVRTQKDGRLKVRVDISGGQDKRIRQVILSFPYAKVKAGQAMDMTFMTEMLVTDKGDAECTLEN